jgi:hypothetical protein
MTPSTWAFIVLHRLFDVASLIFVAFIILSRYLNRKNMTKQIMKRHYLYKEVKASKASAYSNQAAKPKIQQKKP